MLNFEREQNFWDAFKIRNYDGQKKNEVQRASDMHRPVGDRFKTNYG